MLRPRCIPHLLRRQAHSPGLPRRGLVTLAIETSCDDTSVAILSHSPKSSSTTLLFHERESSDNRAFKGVHPVVTVQGHNASLAPMVQRALRFFRAKHTQAVPDFISVTRGPGIMANLAVGLNMAKGLSVAWNIPLVGVHHMQAHALTPRLARALDKMVDGETAIGPEFPFLSLLVSGGHTQLVHSAALTDHRIVATTGDIAIGNLLDQTARVILPPEVLDSSPDVMYGRLLESFAFPSGSQEDYESFFRPAMSRGDEINPVPCPPYDWTVPLPFRNSRRLAYSFSSIHTHVHRICASRDIDNNMSVDERRCLARHTMRAAFQHLVSRLCVALEDQPHLREAARTLVVAGGVASNRFLMHVLRETLRVRGYPDVEIIAPPVELCTDNAAMIAWTGMEMFMRGWQSDLGVRPVGKWPMDPEFGDGILGIEGWLRREGYEGR